MMNFIDKLKALDAEAFCKPWKSDYCGDIYASKATPEYSEATGIDVYPTVCTSSKWRGKDDPNKLLICLLRNNTQAIIELVEAADKLDTGHHAQCNAPLNQWCSCGLTDLKTKLSKLKGDV